MLVSYESFFSVIKATPNAVIFLIFIITLGAVIIQILLRTQDIDHNEPPVLIRKLPVLGHLLFLMRNFQGTLLESGKLSEWKKAGVSTLNAAGQKFYVVTDIRYIALAQRREKTLQVDDFIVHFLKKQTGVTEDGIKKLTDTNGGNGQSPLAASHTFFRNQLHTVGPVQNEILERAHQKIEAQMDAIVKLLMKTDNIDSKFSDQAYPLDFLEWTKTTIFTSMTQAFYGNDILERWPDLVKTFINYDNEAWKMHFGIPKFLAPGVYASGRRLLEIMEEWQSLAPTARPSSLFSMHFEDFMTKAGLTSIDIAAINMPLVVGINSNLMKTCYWTIFQVLSFPGLKEDLIKETIPAYRSIPTSHTLQLTDRSYLINSCPILSACVNETLRVSSAGVGFRKCTKDTALEKYVLKSGAVVVIPSRQLHLSGKVWGSSPETFDYRRFLKEPGLENSQNFRPFGGGLNLCPGKVIAKQIVMIFVSMFLQKLDVIESGVLPRANFRKPNLGIVDPVLKDEKMKLLVKAKVKGF